MKCYDISKVVSPPQNKHILRTCCGVHCLFLRSALLAISLGEVNHVLQLFPCFSSALLLLSFATVRVIVCTWKSVSLFLRISIAHNVPASPESNKFVLLCLETWYWIQLCRTFIARACAIPTFKQNTLSHKVNSLWSALASESTFLLKMFTDVVLTLALLFVDVVLLWSLRMSSSEQQI